MGRFKTLLGIGARTVPRGVGSTASHHADDIARGFFNQADHVTEAVGTRAFRNGAGTAARNADDPMIALIKSGQKTQKYTAIAGAVAATATAAGGAAMVAAKVAAADHVYNTLKDDAAKVGKGLGDAAKASSDTFSKAGSALADQLRDAGHSLSDAAKEGKRGLGSNLNDGLHDAGERMNSLYDGAKDNTEQLLERVNEHVPSFTDAADSVKTLTYGVTAMLAVGVAVYGAYEVYRFTR